MVLGDVLLICHKPLVCTSGSFWTQFRKGDRLPYYRVNLKARRGLIISPHISMRCSNMLTSDGA